MQGRAIVQLRKPLLAEFLLAQGRSAFILFVSPVDFDEPPHPTPAIKTVICFTQSQPTNVNLRNSKCLIDYLGTVLSKVRIQASHL